MDWYVEQFGDGPLRRDAVRPSDLQPSRWDGSEEAARELCVQVCERVGVPADDIRFSFRLEELRTAARSRAARLVRWGLEPHAESADPERAARARALLAITGLPELMSVAETKVLEKDGFEPELTVLSGTESARELYRCQEIRLAEGEQRAAALRAAHTEWDADFVRSTGAIWIDLRRWPGGKPTGYTTSAIVLSENSLKNPASVVAHVVHELGATATSVRSA